MFREQTHLDLDDLRLLAALSGAGSLAGAARALRVNHASAWRRLGALERRLGVRLFERGRTGYGPTPAGVEAIAVAGRVLSDLVDLDRKLAGRDVRPSGTVRLTTTETLLSLVMPAIASLRTVHPGILVEIITSDAFFTLSRRDADIALRPAAAAPEGLVARRLGEIASAVYGAQGYLARCTSADPADHDWIAPDDGLSHLGSSRWMAAAVPATRVVARASSLPGLAAAARAGIGLAPLPCFIGDVDPALMRHAPPLADMASHLWLITHPDLRRTARVRAVLDHLAEALAPSRALLEGRAPQVSPDGGRS